MPDAQPLTYEDWLERSVIDRQHAPEPADAPPPPLGSLGSIPASYIARAIRDQAAGVVHIIGGLRSKGLRIDGDLHIENYVVPFPLFFHGCEFTGVLYVWSLKAHSLGFEGCRLRGGADLRNTSIDGHLLMRNGFVADGPIIARDMKITGTADFSGATFAYDGQGPCALKEAARGDGFGFSRSTVTTIYWRGLQAKPAGRVTFRDAHARSFVHDLNCAPPLRSWPAPGQLNLDGFSYDRIDQCDPQRAMDWLALQPEFSASSYAALAKGYEKLHLRQNAEVVWATLKRREISQLHPRIRRWLNYLVFSLIGFGQKPTIALFVLAALFVVHLGTVVTADRFHMMRPTVNEMLLESCFYGPGKPCAKDISHWQAVNIGAGQRRYVPSDYPELSPIEYSLESFIPLLPLDQGKYWEPSSVWLRIFLPSLAAFGIFLGGLFAGSIAGLLTPKARDYK